MLSHALVRRITNPTRLEVDDPIAVAAKCWDAGYTVCVVDPDHGDTRLALIDPFGRRIELAQPEDFHYQSEVHT